MIFNQQLGQFGRTLLTIPVQDKCAVATAFPASNFTTTSATFVNLLNGAGGSAITVTLPKGAGTNILIAMGLQCSKSGTQRVSLGVNDGTSDYDVSCNSFGVTNNIEGICGERLLSGLGSGIFTFTFRVRINGAATLTFGTAGSAYLRAWEVAG